MMLKLNGNEARLVICTNDEVLCDVWNDIYLNAGISDFSDNNKEIAVVWVHTFRDAVYEACDVGSDIDYNSDFRYWNGGPGHGTAHFRDVDWGFDEAVITECRNAADKAAREYAQQLVEDMTRQLDK